MKRRADGSSKLKQEEAGMFYYYYLFVSSSSAAASSPSSFSSFCVLLLSCSVSRPVEVDLTCLDHLLVGHLVLARCNHLLKHCRSFFP